MIAYRLFYIPALCLLAAVFAAVNLNTSTSTIFTDIDHDYGIGTGIPTEYSRDDRPLLVIHAGPMKTGSTTIQMALQKKALRFKLVEDNFTDLRMGYKSELGSCFTYNGCTDQQWGEFLVKLEKVRVSGCHAYMSNEGFSSVRVNDRNEERFRSISKKWNIRVVLIYRPFHEWVFSMYSHKNKIGLLRYPKHGINYNGTIVSPIHIWIEEFIIFGIDNHTLNDPLSAKLKFDHFFHNTVVVNMYSQRDLLENFFWTALPEAKATFSAVKKISKRKENQSAKFQSDFETDIILGEAYKQHLIHDDNDRNDVRAALKTEIKIMKQNGSLPRLCITNEQQSILWNRTLISEKMLSKNPRPENDLRDWFMETAVGKFCSVDAVEFLKNEKWREVISKISLYLKDQVK